VWIVGFGEDRVSFRWFSWEFLSFFFFFFFSSDSVFIWGISHVFWGLRCVLVGFLLVVMMRNCKLWV